MTNINDWLQTWTGDHCDSEGGGGGGDFPIWHVTINSVAVPENGFSYNSTVGEQEIDGNYNQYYKNFLDDDGKWFSSYGVGLDSGVTNKELSFVILDDTVSAVLYMNEPVGCSVSVTGSVEFVDDEGWNFNITGDGTITITEA